MDDHFDAILDGLIRAGEARVMMPLDDHLKPGAKFSPPDQPTNDTVTLTGDGTQPTAPDGRPLNPDGSTGHSSGEPSITPTTEPATSTGDPVPLTPPDSPSDFDSLNDRLKRIEQGVTLIKSKLDLIIRNIAG